MSEVSTSAPLNSTSLFSIALNHPAASLTVAAVFILAAVALISLARSEPSVSPAAISSQTSELTLQQPVRSDNQTSTATGSSVSGPSITVNGRSIEVPANGSYRETIQTGDTTTRVEASNTKDQNGTSSSTSTSLSVHNESNSSTGGSPM